MNAVLRKRKRSLRAEIFSYPLIYKCSFGAVWDKKNLTAEKKIKKNSQLIL